MTTHNDKQYRFAVYACSQHQDPRFRHLHTFEQAASCVEFGKRRYWTYVESYTDPNGFDGDYSNRTRLFEEVAADKMDIVVVRSLPVFTRSVATMTQILVALAHAKVEVVTMDGSLDLDHVVAARLNDETEPQDVNKRRRARMLEEMRADIEALARRGLRTDKDDTTN